MTEETLFAAALDRADPAERSAFLDAHCPDPAARRRVEELLAAHAAAGSFLDHPAVGADVTTDLPPSAPGVTRTQAPTDPDATADPRTGHANPDEALAFLKPPTRPGSLGRLAHYEVLEVLGSGGFGTVLKAFDDRLHRVVAVKVLAPQLAASGAARARFLREARTAAAVRDEHVVNVFAVSDDDAPVPFLVMELVAGQTLQGKIDKTGPLPPKEVLRIGSQVARGLAAAHKQGLIHRDIKPANILLENGVERVKVTDFGLARAADDASQTQSGVVAGTPMYMSPEQARGDTLDTRSDLFSLGSVLYVLCTGRPPFRAETTLAVLKRVVEDDPRPVRDVNPEVPSWLADVVAMLHAKAPADRFQTAAEVAELLSSFLAELQQGMLVSPLAALRAAVASRRAVDQQQGTVVSRVAPPPRPVVRTGWGWWFAAALVLAGLLTAGGVLGESDPPVPRRQVHYDFVTVFAVGGLLMLVPAAALMPFSRRWGARGVGVAGASLLAAAANGALAFLSPTVFIVPHRQAVLTLRLSNTAMQYRIDETGPHQTGIAVIEVPLDAGEHWVWFQLGDRAYRTAKFRLEPGARNELIVTAAAGGFATATLDGTPIGVTGGPGLLPTRALQAPFDPDTARDAQEAWAKQLGVPVEFAHPSGPTFRLIPPGEYGMGFTDVELAAVRKTLQGLPNVGAYQRFAAESSGPRHTVRITRPFYLAKYETTAGQFRRFVEAAKHAPTGPIDWQSFVTPGEEERQPVVGVSWADAEAFCRRLGPGYELPTEAQWEYAARGGAPGLWSFGNDPTKLLDHAVFGQAWPKPAPVGQKAPNPFGLFDVNGNADEWCRDWHVADFYRRSPIDDPVNLADPADPATGRASRGGSWNAAAVYSEVAFRSFDHPTRPALPKGFRVALTGDLKAAVDAAARASPEPGWTPLFNKVDLTGWKTHPEQPGRWAVRDGVLIGSGKAGYLFSDGEYEDFHLRAEVKVNETGNSGLLFHAEYGFNFDLARFKGGGRAPVGYEVELVTPKGVGGTSVAGSVARAGPDVDITRSRVRAKWEGMKADTWVKLEVVAKGDRRTVRVDDREVLSFDEPNPVRRRGHFALQLFTADTVAAFRNIEVKVLPAAASADPPTDGFVSLFNGKDQTGLTSQFREAWTVKDGALTANGPARIDAPARAGDAHYRVVLKAEQAPSVVLSFGNPPGGPAAQVKLTSDDKAGWLSRAEAGRARPLTQMPAALLRPGEWATVEVVSRGDDVTVRVDGKEVGRAVVAGLPAERTLGVSLAAGTLHVRRIEVKELPAATPPAPPSAVAPFTAAEAKAHQEAWAAHLGVKVEFVNDNKMTMRLVPPGKNHLSNDGLLPVPAEAARPHYVGAHEVTVGQFQRFVAATGHQPVYQGGKGGYLIRDKDIAAPGGPPRRPELAWNHPEVGPSDDHPVAMVNYYDAKAFCDWLTRTEGRTYRLPTVEEWRWLAAAGAKGFYFEADGGKLGDHAWVPANSDYHTHPVGKKAANPWGLYDVYGNVFELGEGWLAADQRTRVPAPADPKQVTDQTQIVHGGSYRDTPPHGRAYGFIGLSYPSSHMGFRVVAEALPAAPAAAAPAAAPTGPRYTNGLGMALVRVPKGSALLGGGGGKAGTKAADFPADFYLGAYEVTQDEWVRVTGSNPSHFSRGGKGVTAVGAVPDADLKRFPVESVSWDDAQEFVAALNRRERPDGWVYRLPTLAEWEYACRGGPGADGSFDFYAGAPSNELAAGAANVKRPGGPNRPVPVGGFPPNGLGLHDMHGNVFEWCHDAEPRKGTGPPNRTGRGGSWDQDAAAARLAVVNGAPANFRNHDLGLRVALVPVPPADGFTSLFNGKDLTGWTVDRLGFEGKDPPFRVVPEDGAPAIHVPRTTKGKLAFLHSREPFENYHLRLEYKVPAAAAEFDGSVVFHRHGQKFAYVAFQDGRPMYLNRGGRVGAQGLLRDGGVRAGDPLPVRLAFSPYKAAPRGEWHRFEIASVGATTLFLVNGEVVGAATDWRNEAGPVTGGGVGLAADAGEMFVRRVEVRPITDLSQAAPALRPAAPAPQPGTLVLPAPGPADGVLAALLRARRERVAAAEKELAAVKARFDAGILTRRDLAEAEAALIEARLDGAPGAAAVRLLGQLVEKHQTRREVVALRVEAGILTPADLNPIDADVAKAKARFAEARLAAPPPAAAPFNADQAKAHQEAWAKHLGVLPEVSNDLGMRFRVVPAGSFQMGSTAEEVALVLKASPDLRDAEAWIQDRVRSEAPARKVTVTEPFLLGVHEVTVGQFREFVKATGHKTSAEQTGGGAVWDNATKKWGQDPEAVWHNPKFAASESHPAVFLNPADARAFCAWLGKLDGRTYAVPTEEQWEFACRAGTATRWWFGDDPAGMKGAGWTVETAFGTHRPVGQLRANPFGLFDLHGNATEMTTSPQGEVYERGGQANETAWRARSAWRNPVVDDSRPHGRRGFRVAIVGDPAPRPKE